VAVATRISTKGQVVIPAEVRKRLGLERNAQLRVEVDDDRVVLRPVRGDAWRGLRGIVRGPSLTRELEREHRDEAARDA
jgi:AbrB family looped-hinge helix DNA binding protein